MDVSADSQQQQIEDLSKVTEQARHCVDSQSSTSAFSDHELGATINNEIAAGSVLLDEDNFEQSARDLILAHIREYHKTFSDVQTEFNARFQPFEAQIVEWEGIADKRREAEQIRDRRVAEERDRLDRDPVSEDYLGTKSRYDQELEAHASKPLMSAVSDWFPGDLSPLYLLLLFCVGITEWFINYNTLLSFLNVPAVAMAGTGVIALALAMASHVHGTDLKQWKKKFGPAVEGADRPYGFLILATVTVIVIFATVGWMRYQATMSVLQSQNSGNLLGSQFAVQAYPGRDVVISMGMNVLVWLAGTILAYYMHDPDAGYVKSALDFMKSRRKYEKEKKQFLRIAKQIVEQCKEKLEREENRNRKFEGDKILREAKNLRNQMQRYEEGLRERAKTYLITQRLRYRNALIKALAENPDVGIYKHLDGKTKEISITDYRALELNIPEHIFSEG